MVAIGLVVAPDKAMTGDRVSNETPCGMGVAGNKAAGELLGDELGEDSTGGPSFVTGISTTGTDEDGAGGVLVVSSTAGVMV